MTRKPMKKVWEPRRGPQRVTPELIRKIEREVEGIAFLQGAEVRVSFFDGCGMLPMDFQKFITAFFRHADRIEIGEMKYADRAN